MPRKKNIIKVNNLFISDEINSFPAINEITDEDSKENMNDDLSNTYFEKDQELDNNLLKNNEESDNDLSNTYLEIENNENSKNDLSNIYCEKDEVYVKDLSNVYSDIQKMGCSGSHHRTGH